MHRSLAVSVALKLYDRVHASAYVREGQETYYRISIDRSDQAPASSHQPRLIHSFHYAVCSHVRSYICAGVYATRLYIQPLNKKLLDLSSSPAYACILQLMAASDRQALKKVLLQSYAELAVRDVVTNRPEDRNSATTVRTVNW